MKESLTKAQKRPTKRSKSKAGKRGKRAKSKFVPGGSLAAKRLYDGHPPGYRWPPNQAMADAGKACEAQLDKLGVQWEHAKPEGRIADPITIKDMMLGGVKYTNWFGEKANSKMECQLALALARIGPELRVLGVREVKFGCIYDWSYVPYQGGRILSRHAIAVAMDIGAFVDDTGREIRVDSGYPKRDNLLIALEQLFINHASFHNILSPKNDPKGHYNHFHVEAVVDFTLPKS